MWPFRRRKMCQVIPVGPPADGFVDASDLSYEPPDQAGMCYLVGDLYAEDYCTRDLLLIFHTDYGVYKIPVETASRTGRVFSFGVHLHVYRQFRTTQVDLVFSNEFVCSWPGEFVKAENGPWQFQTTTNKLLESILQ